MAYVTACDRMLIGGELVHGASGDFDESINQATEEVIGRSPQGTREDVDRAFAAADAAWPTWAALTPSQRGARMRAFGEALKPEFKLYAQQVVKNAQALAGVLVERGLAIVSGGTDSHLMLVDLRPKGVTGKATEHELEKALMTCNKNGVPFDTAPFTVTSGVRLGTPAGTTRGFGEEEFKQIGHWIADVVSSMNGGDEADPAVVAGVAAQVRELTNRFPIYG